MNCDNIRNAFGTGRTKKTAVRYTAVGNIRNALAEQEKQKTVVRFTVVMDLAVRKEGQRAEIPGEGYGGMVDEQGSSSTHRRTCILALAFVFVLVSGVAVTVAPRERQRWYLLLVLPFTSV